MINEDNEGMDTGSPSHEQAPSQPPPPPPPPPPQHSQDQPIYTHQPLSALHPPVSVGAWIVAMLLMLIPIVNIVLIFVWAFGGNTNPSKSNYFKAILIVIAISIALGIIFSIAFAGVVAAIFSNAFRIFH